MDPPNLCYTVKDNVTEVNVSKGNKRKSEQLGINFGTASGRLRKDVMFHLLQKHGENVCYRCKEFIETVKELSIEHKRAWLDSEDPVGLFFDLENVAFSHLSCNISESRTRNGRRSRQECQAVRNGCTRRWREQHPEEQKKRRKDQWLRLRS